MRATNVEPGMSELLNGKATYLQYFVKTLAQRSHVVLAPLREAMQDLAGN